MLEKMRKQARNAKTTRMSAPASSIVNTTSQVHQAPKGLVQEYKRDSQHKQTTAATAAALAATRRLNPPTTTPKPNNTTTDRAFQEREDRLRALTRTANHTHSHISQLDGPSTPKKSRSIARPNGLAEPKSPVAQLNVAFLEDTDDEDEKEVVRSKPKSSLGKKQPPDTSNRLKSGTSPLPKPRISTPLKRKAGSSADSTPKKGQT